MVVPVMLARNFWEEAQRALTLGTELKTSLLRHKISKL